VADPSRIFQPWWLPNPGIGDELVFGALSAWDVVYLDGTALPGISEVKPGRGHSLQIKQSAGRHFATLTDSGYKPCDLIITTKIWTPTQWNLWQRYILPYIEPDPGPKYKLPTFNISHPATYSRRIDTISIEHILGPIYKGKGVVEFTLKCLDAKQDKTNATNTPKNAGITPFSNALTGNKNKPSGAPIPTKPPGPPANG
jgi:hypothetical protein